MYLHVLAVCLRVSLLAGALASTQQRVAFDSSFVSSVTSNIGCVMAEVWPPLMAISSAFESDFLVQRSKPGSQPSAIGVGGGVAAYAGADDNATAQFMYSNFRSLSDHFVMGFVGFEDGKFIGYIRNRKDITWPDLVYLQNENSTCDFKPHNITQLCRRSYVNTTNKINGRANGPGRSLKVYDTRLRPWYIGAKADVLYEGTYWSNIYSFASYGTLGMTAGVQLKDSSGVFLGVAGLDYKLSELESALQLDSYYNDDGVINGDTMTTFIVDSAGSLVGSSVSNVSFIDGAQVVATSCRNKIIRTTAELYSQHFGWSDKVVKTVTIGGSLYFSQSVHHTDDHGLSWFIVVVQRVLCPEGYRVENETASCVECVFPYTATGGADSAHKCRLCAENYYMAPDGTCKRCKKKDGTDCSGAIGFTVENFNVLPGFYRLGLDAEEVYECPIKDHCIGNSSCSSSSKGPLCTTCNVDFYFNQGKRDCSKCKHHIVVFKVIQSVSLFIGMLLVIALFIKHQSAFSEKLSNSKTTIITKMSLAFKKITSAEFLARAKILWTAYQVVAATKKTLPTLSFPRLFYDIRDALGNVIEFNFIQLPGTEIQCFLGRYYNHYTQLVGVTLFPVFAYAWIVVGLLCANRRLPREEKKAVGYWSTFLLVSYLTLPNVSEVCFSMFDCVEFVEGGDRTRKFLAVDHSISCDARNTQLAWARAYACLAMLSPLGGPLGTPLLCAWLLRANRARIQSPLGDTPAERHHSRSLDTKLNHLRWIFASYTCECWWFETCEIVRRVLLTGALVLIPVENIEVRLMTAILLAFASVIVHETTRPYQDFGTNILALCSHIVIFGLFFLGSQINCGVISGEFLLALVICGPLLLPIAVMVYLQWSEEERLRIKRLNDLESEVQKDEIKAQLRQMLLAEERLLTKMHLREEAGHEQARRRSTMVRLANTSRSRASVSNDADFMKRLEFRQESLVVTKFDHKFKYPCYVVDLDVILTLDTLPTHEEALQQGILELLSRDSDQPNPAHTFFISQNWEGNDGGHPDNEKQTKLGFLKNFREHCSVGDHRTWIWLDIFSIPQADRKKQLLAIDSIQYYAALMSRFIPLVRDETQWRDSFEIEPSRMFLGGPVRGTLATYQSRGWCRLEVFCALCPKRFRDGSWRPGPIGLRFYYHTASVDDSGSSMGPPLEASSLLDPLEEGIEYTCCWRARKDNVEGHICDRPKIKRIVGEVACQYIDYCRSGSTSWDTTLDMLDLPDWIHDAARDAHVTAAAAKTERWHQRCRPCINRSALIGARDRQEEGGDDEALDVEDQKRGGQPAYSHWGAGASPTVVTEEVNGLESECGGEQGVVFDFTALVSGSWWPFSSTADRPAAVVVSEGEI